MSIADRRKMLEAAQALAKTNNPTRDHYENLLSAIATIFHDDTGIECECVIRVERVK